MGLTRATWARIRVPAPHLLVSDKADDVATSNVRRHFVGVDDETVKRLVTTRVRTKQHPNQTGSQGAAVKS